MKRTLNSWLFFLVTSFSFFATSQNKIVTINSTEQKEIVLDQNSLLFWENSENKKIDLTEKELKQLDFKKLPGKVPNFGFIQHDVWFTFRIANSSKQAKKMILSLSNPNLDYLKLITFYSSNDKIRIQSTGDLANYSSREIESKKLAFPLLLNVNDTNTYYLKVNNGGEQFHFSPIIYAKDTFLQNESGENYFLGIYFGILFFVMLFNVFMWIITKEAISKEYSLYLITFFFLQLSLLGFGKQYVWQNSEFLTNHANPFFASLSVYFLLRFSCLYLNLAILLPKVNKFFVWLQYAILLCAIFSLIPLGKFYTSSILLVNGLTLILNIFILPVAVVVARKGFRPANLFLIAFFLLVVSVFAFVLKNAGILPSNFYTDFGFQFGSAAEVILFSLAIVIRFKKFREESIGRLQELNELKEEANILLEQKVIERTLEIEEQKQVIEDKTKEIISSISYAKRIQEAILPTDEKLKHLLPNSVLWYAPKDIVAGDFYWIELKHIKGKDYTFFAVGDCTGHGVPGAMMSLLCSNSLNASLAELKIPGVAQVLEKSSAILVDNLSQYTKEINDGMDISIACLDPETNTLFWAGANNALWILRNKELIEYTGTKRPVGKSSSAQAFEEHQIKLEVEDRIFLFTDGIVDQFGGTNNKKFMKSRLRECMLHSAEFPLAKQLEYIQKAVIDWQSEEEQVDDIALLIIEIN